MTSYDLLIKYKKLMLILTTPQELRQYQHTSVVETIENYNGYIASSQNQFLMPYIGKPLFNAVLAKYEEYLDKEELLIGVTPTPWIELIQLCQKPVACDILYRSAHSSAVSVNDSGINVVETGGYDKADREDRDLYRKDKYKEAHEAIDYLLATLEEWAEEVGLYDSEDLSEEQQDKKDIVTLWRQSRYYYFADGLFINTAKVFNSFVNIYDNREKFIQMLPDLRFCNEFVIRPELGDALTDDLIRKMQDGALSPVERQAVYLAQYALALKVEERSPLFKRPEAKDEAIGALRRMIDYISAHQGDFDAEAIKGAPFYKEPAPDPKPEAKPAPPVVPWRNNRRGNKLFVTPPIE